MKLALTSSGYTAYGADTATTTQIPATTTATTLLTANSGRLHGSVFNDSTSPMYVLWWTTGTVSPTFYTVKIPAQGFYELPRINTWLGTLTGVWALAAGNAYVTEAS